MPLNCHRRHGKNQQSDIKYVNNFMSNSVAGDLLSQHGMLFERNYLVADEDVNYITINASPMDNAGDCNMRGFDSELEEWCGGATNLPILQ